MTRCAIVFGGSGGLGEGCVRALARDRPVVTITYHNSRARAEAVAADLPEGCTGYPVQCDVADSTSVCAVVAEVLAQCGPIGCVVFSAGCAIDQPYISQIGEDQWREVFETETLGFTRVVSAVLPLFREQKGGNIVAVTSMAPGAMNAGLGEQYIAEKMNPDFWETFRKSIRLRRFGLAQDIGEAAAFFASERASYLTGQTLIVDGGYTL